MHIYIYIVYSCKHTYTVYSFKHTYTVYSHTSGLPSGNTPPGVATSTYDVSTFLPGC